MISFKFTAIESNETTELWDRSKNEDQKPDLPIAVMHQEIEERRKKDSFVCRHHTVKRWRTVKKMCATVLAQHNLGADVAESVLFKASSKGQYKYNSYVVVISIQLIV